MEDFFVQECCVHGTDLENHGPTLILCDDPLPIESIVQLVVEPMDRFAALGETAGRYHLVFLIVNANI